MTSSASNQRWRYYGGDASNQHRRCNGGDAHGTALVTPARPTVDHSSKLKTGRPWVTPNPTRPSIRGRIC